MVGGEIKVVMTLDNGQFLVETRKAGQAIYSVRKTLDDTAKSVKTLETHFTSFGQKFQDVTLRISLMRFALHDIYDIFLRFPVAVLKTAGEFERLTALLEGMSRATDETGKKLEALREKKYIINLAMHSPFNIEAIQDAFVKFKSVGIDPTNGSVKALTDSVAKFGGTPELMHRAAIAIQQMVGKGVVSMEELRQQLGEAIPNAMQLMAQGLGLTVAEMVKKVSKGTVEANNAVRNMLAIMAVDNMNAAAKMAETWPGLLARVKTSFSLFMNDIGTSGFSDKMKTEVEKFFQLMSGSDAKLMARDIGNLFASILSGATATIKFFVDWGAQIKMIAGLLSTLYVGNKIGKYFKDLARGSADSIAAIKAKSAAVIAEQVKEEKAVAASISKKMLMEKAAYEQKGVQLQAELTRQIAHQAKLAALEAKALAVSGQARRAGGALNANQAEIARQISNYKQLEAGSTAYVTKLRLEAAAHLANSNALAASGRSQMAHVISLTNTTRAMTAMRTVMTGMQAAFTAVGGWVTVLTAAIIYLGMKLIEWGNRAEVAAQKAKDAKAGMTDAADAAEHAASLEEKRRKVAYLSDSLERKNPLTGGNWVTGAQRRQLEANFVKEHAEYSKMLKDDTNFKTSAFDKSIREQLAGMNRGIDMFIEGKRAQMEKLNAPLAEEQQKNPKINNSEKMNKNRQNMSSSVLAELVRLQSGTTAKIKTATGENLRAFTAYKKQLDELIEQWKGTDADLAKVGNLVEISMPGAKDGGKKTPLDHWNDALQTMKEKVAGLRQELDKEDTGWFGKMVEDLKGKGVALGVQKMAELKKYFNDVTALKGQIKLDDKVTNTTDLLTSAIAGLKEELDGGTSAVGRYKEKISDLKTELDGLVKEGGDQSGIAALEEKIKKLQALVATFEGLQKQKKQNDSVNLTKDLLDKANSIAVSTKSQSDQLMAAFAKENSSEAEKVLKALDISDTDRKAIMAAMSRTAAEGVAVDTTDIKGEMVRMVEALQAGGKQLTAEEKALVDGFIKYRTAAMEKLAFDMEGPLEKMTRKWKETGDAIKEATAEWGQGAIDVLVDGLVDGEWKLKDYFKNMWKRILKINLQSTMSDLVNNTFKSLGGFLTKAMDGMQPAAPAANGQPAATDDLSGWIGKLATGFKDLWSNGVTKTTASMVKSVTEIGTQSTATITATSSLELLASAAMKAASALTGMNGGSVAGGSGGGGILGSAMGMFGGGTPAWDTGEAFTSSADAFSSIDFNMLDAFSAFANGGIMTSMGSVSLKKYANGGIADRPQLSMFGEGSTPEAYVPLPDGRSIPVSMTGGGGTTNNVTVIVQSGPAPDVRRAAGQGARQALSMLKGAERYA